jgi:O-antigen/teichoic acid export membrane protein
MGIIRKQSIQTTLLSYCGFGLGYVNAVLLFPALFSPEEFGLTRVLIAVINVAAQFALFGMTNAIIRYFPRFKQGDEKGHHGLLGISVLWGLLGIVVMSLVIYVAQPWVIEYKRDSSALFVDYYILLFPFLIFEVFYQLLANYTRALYHSVVNVFFKEVFLRLTTTILILLFYLNLVSIEQFMALFVAQQGLLALGMALYLKEIGHLNFKIDKAFLTPELKKEMIQYRSFTTLTNVSAYMLMSVDIVMIGYMIGLESTAFYAVAFYIVALLNIPRNAISNIALPVVSDAWKREDRDTVQNVYAKTSINQLLIGTLIFVGIWANQANIFQILPPEYSDGKWVLFYVGLARLADVGFGLNGGVITTSKWYRFDTYANVILLVVTVSLNLVFIPKYGIIGAAMATAISLFFFNLAKYVFLKIKFGFEPFTWKSFAVLLLGIGTYLLSEIVPAQENFVVDILIRSTIIVLVFTPLAYLLKLSEDVNAFVLAMLHRLKS